MDNRWRKGAYGTCFFLMACLTSMFIWKIANVAQSDLELKNFRSPHFGHLPNIRFWHENTIYGLPSTTYGYFNIMAENGMEIQLPETKRRLGIKQYPGIGVRHRKESRYNVENISIWVTPKSKTHVSTILFNTSELLRPYDQQVIHDYPHSAPEPKLSFAILFKNQEVGRIMKGFYMTLEDPITGVSAYMGGISPAEETLAQGRVNTFIFNCRKEVHNYWTTEKTLIMKYLTNGFSKEHEYLRVHNLFNLEQAGVNCSDNEWMFKPIPKEAGGAAEAPANLSACLDAWRVLHVVLIFDQEAVDIREWQGRPFQLFRLVCGVGGLWTVCTTVFFMCYYLPSVHGNRNRKRWRCTGEAVAESAPA